jgi:hypothetical protein
VIAPRWPAPDQVQVEVGNRITRRITRLPSDEILGGELDPNLLELGFVKFSVDEGGSALWYGIVGRSLIVRSVVPLVRGSTVGDPLSYSSVVGVLTNPATVNKVMPSGGLANRPWSTCVLGV